MQSSSDISRALEKVWQERLLLKIDVNGISGNLLKHLFDYQKQRVVSNRLHSSWSNVNAGVTEGAMLGYLNFVICIINLSNR